MDGDNTVVETCDENCGSKNISLISGDSYTARVQVTAGETFLGWDNNGSNPCSTFGTTNNCSFVAQSNQIIEASFDKSCLTESDTQTYNNLNGQPLGTITDWTNVSAYSGTYGTGCDYTCSNGYRKSSAGNLACEEIQEKLLFAVDAEVNAPDGINSNYGDRRDLMTYNLSTGSIEKVISTERNWGIGNVSQINNQIPTIEGDINYVTTRLARPFLLNGKAYFAGGIEGSGLDGIWETDGSELGTNHIISSGLYKTSSDYYGWDIPYAPNREPNQTFVLNNHAFVRTSNAVKMIYNGNDYSVFGLPSGSYTMTGSGNYVYFMRKNAGRCYLEYVDISSNNPPYNTVDINETELSASSSTCSDLISYDGKLVLIYTDGNDSNKRKIYEIDPVQSSVSLINTDNLVLHDSSKGTSSPTIIEDLYLLDDASTLYFRGFHGALDSFNFTLYKVDMATKNVSLASSSVKDAVVLANMGTKLILKDTVLYYSPSNTPNLAGTVLFDSDPAAPFGGFPRTIFSNHSDDIEIKNNKLYSVFLRNISIWDGSTDANGIPVNQVIITLPTVNGVTSNFSKIKDWRVLGSNDTIFFAAAAPDTNGDSLGIELWKSDGTQSGTILIQDLLPGSDSSAPGNFIVIE